MLFFDIVVGLKKVIYLLKQNNLMAESCSVTKLSLVFNIKISLLTM